MFLSLGSQSRESRFVYDSRLILDVGRRCMESYPFLRFIPSFSSNSQQVVGQ